MKTLLKICGVIIGCCAITINGQEINPKKIFKTWDEASKSPTEVQWLSLEGQQTNLENLDFSKYKNLEYLSVRNLHLQQLPKGIEELTNLKFLDISGNELTFLPDSFTNLQSLEELYLDNYALNNIEETLGILSLLPNLKRLKLANIESQNLPKNIAKRTHLEELAINEKIIKKKPIQIKELPNLNSAKSKNPKLPVEFQGVQDINFGFAIRL